MEATLVVKQFGLTNAEFIVNGTELTELAIHSQCCGVSFTDTVNVADLKRVIESHHIIEKLGGLELAKIHNDKLCKLNAYFSSVEANREGHRVWQAIKDVEQSI